MFRVVQVEEKVQERQAGWCWPDELHTTNTSNRPTGNFLNPPFVKSLLTKKITEMFLFYFMFFSG